MDTEKAIATYKKRSRNYSFVTCLGFELEPDEHQDALVFLTYLEHLLHLSRPHLLISKTEEGLSAILETNSIPNYIFTQTAKDFYALLHFLRKEVEDKCEIKKVA